MNKTIEVLMVDDDSGDVRLTQEALKADKADIRMTVCVDGQDCMDYLRRLGKYANATRPDIILMDLNMPRKNGLEALREIKANPDLCAIPVVILTTSDSDVDVYAAFREMAASFVTKPVDLPKFRQVIQDLGKYWTRVSRVPPKSQLAHVGRRNP